MLVGSIMVEPSKGNAGFGSGSYGWAFSLKQFGKTYADKFNIDLDKMMTRMWVFKPKTKEWTKGSKPDDDNYKRAFNMFIPDLKLRSFRCYHEL